jgi:hypothetical protein
MKLYKYTCIATICLLLLSINQADAMIDIDNETMDTREDVSKPLFPIYSHERGAWVTPEPLSIEGLRNRIRSREYEEALRRDLAASSPLESLDYSVPLIGGISPSPQASENFERAKQDWVKRFIDKRILEELNKFKQRRMESGLKANLRSSLADFRLSAEEKAKREAEEKKRLQNEDEELKSITGDKALAAYLQEAQDTIKKEAAKRAESKRLAAAESKS